MGLTLFNLSMSSLVYMTVLFHVEFLCSIFTIQVILTSIVLFIKYLLFNWLCSNKKKNPTLYGDNGQVSVYKYMHQDVRIIELTEGCFNQDKTLIQY